MNLSNNDVQYQIMNNANTDYIKLQKKVSNLQTKILMLKNFIYKQFKQELLVVEEPKKKPELNLIKDKISNACCKAWMIPDVELLKHKTRERKIVQARQYAMYLSVKKTHSSLKSIGKYFGGRDHSTVNHSIQTVRNYLDENVLDELSLEFKEKAKKADEYLFEIKDIKRKHTRN